MNNYEKIEAILMRMKTAQEGILAAEKKIDECFKKVVPFMNKVNSDVNVVSGGFVPAKVDFVDKDGICVANEEEFVETMSKIRWMSSSLSKTKAYLDVIKKINGLRKSAKSKIAKLDSRIKYMVKHNQTDSADYSSSQTLRLKTRDGLAVLTRRMEIVLMEFMKVRTKILEEVCSETISACDEVEDILAITRCSVRNDDGVAMAYLERFKDIVRKGMKYND